MPEFYVPGYTPCGLPNTEGTFIVPDTEVIARLNDRGAFARQADRIELVRAADVPLQRTTGDHSFAHPMENLKFASVRVLP